MKVKTEPVSEIITYEEFRKVDIRIGKVLEVERFPEAIKPAYIMHIDFGESIGIKKTSAQITELYSPTELSGKLVMAVVNLSKKQIGPIHSECLVTGFYKDNFAVVLATVEMDVPLGTRLC
jgi:tRNA-binding protein